jgi:hypothetical protein
MKIEVSIADRTKKPIVFPVMARSKYGQDAGEIVLFVGKQIGIYLTGPDKGTLQELAYVHDSFAWTILPEGSQVTFTQENV